MPNTGSAVRRNLVSSQSAISSDFQSVPQNPLLDSGYWKSLSDEQLVATDFRTEDPTLVENIIRDLPLTGERPIVESAYNTKTSTGRKVYCLHCKHDTHFRGFVLLLPTGQRMLVGKDCGKKIYGADFDRIEKDFSDARQRAQLLSIRASVASGAPSFRAAVRSLKNDPALELFQDVKRAWNQAVPLLARALAEVCTKGGGTLYITDKIRDFAAEERREERQFENAKLVGTMTKTAVRKARENGDLPSNGRRPKPLYREVPKLLGTLAGQGFFRADQLPHRNIDELGVRAEQILDQLTDGRHSTAQLRLIFQNLRHVVEALAAEIGRLNELFEAFELRNLTNIASWANHREIGRNSYFAAVGNISCHDHFGGEPISVTFPAEYRVPSVMPFQRFLQILS
jgi:hypothetical protein